MASPLAVRLRTAGRSALYRTPLHRVLRWLAARAGRTPANLDAAQWDAKLAGAARPYLGGTINNDLRDAVTANLIRHLVPGAQAVLDVGCAAGSLGRALRASGVTRYVGVDISRVAVAAADPAAGEFHVSDLQSFDPLRHGPFDAVVLNEVLYYSDVDAAVVELARYARALRPGGAVVCSMKDDPKSQAILDGALGTFEWVTGVLFQEQRDRGGWRVKLNRERPAYLVCVLRARDEGAAAN